MMTEQQAEKILGLLEKIAGGSEESKTAIKLELEMYLYDEGARKRTETKKYIRFLEFPFPLNMEVGSHTNVNIDGVTFNGPDFYSDDTSVPVFNGNISIHFKEKDAYKKRLHFSSENEKLIQKGWQLVAGDPEE